MKITKKQLERLVENIVVRERVLREANQYDKIDFENAAEGLERLRPKYGKLMSKMNSKQMKALLDYFARVSSGLAYGGHHNHIPQEEHFLKFFAYIHGGPKP